MLIPVICSFIIWAVTQENLSSVFPTKRDSNPSPLHAATETSQKIANSPVASLDLIDPVGLFSLKEKFEETKIINVR